MPPVIRKALQSVGDEHGFDASDHTYKVDPASLIGRHVQRHDVPDGSDMTGEIVDVLDDNAEQVSVLWNTDHNDMLGTKPSQEPFDERRET